MVRKAEETRFELQKDRMLKAAARCFNEKGYSGSSLKDVAKRLGLTDAALYYYVRNKEELVYLCYVRAAEVGRESLDRAIAEGSDGYDTLEEVPMTVLLPSFLTSELKTAFQIGFLTFIPFLIIDLVVSSVLMSMGMMMLSPMLISLPFKIMLFVLVDGWTLIVGTLATSFTI